MVFTATATPQDVGAAVGAVRGLLTRLRIQNVDVNARLFMGEGTAPPVPTGIVIEPGVWFEFEVFADPGVGSFGWWAWCSQGACSCYVTPGLRG